MSINLQEGVKKLFLLIIQHIFRKITNIQKAKLLPLFLLSPFPLPVSPTSSEKPQCEQHWLYQGNLLEPHRDTFVCIRIIRPSEKQNCFIVRKIFYVSNEIFLTRVQRWTCTYGILSQSKQLLLNLFFVFFNLCSFSFLDRNVSFS